MKILAFLLDKGRDSSFYRWVLNKVLGFVIPFNKPHHFRISIISEEEIEVSIPYKRRNLNHIKSLHACALATLCEYACGLKLAQLLGEQYRIIMKEMNMEYFYQGKCGARVNFRLPKDRLEKEITGPLEKEDAVLKTFELKVFDELNNHLCTGRITWQIKYWKKVKTVI